MHLTDILGPIMVGPSSSHTAGAVKIGRVARKLLGEEPVKAEIFLHGSFTLTGKRSRHRPCAYCGAFGYARR